MTGVDPPRLLLVEDEEILAAPMRRGLEEEGYQVRWIADGQQGLREALAGEYDALVVDWRLPGIDGSQLVRRLRAAGDETPALMLTALRDVRHRVAGLDAGADDYLTKPFSFEELLARLRALRRRSLARPETSEGELPLRVGALEIDALGRSATLLDEPLDLRSKELSLLALLARRAGDVVTRTAIAERIWGSAFEVSDNAIDITVSTLRAKLRRDPTAAPCIETVRGVGYRLVERDEDHGTGARP